MDDNNEYKFYWETKMFLENMDGFVYSDLSSPDGFSAGTCSSKNMIIPEKKGRMELDEKLYGLRSVVPNITKMDKISIIKDAIDYIQELQEEERKLSMDISEMDNMTTTAIDRIKPTAKEYSGCNNNSFDFEPLAGAMDVEVSEVGEKTWFVSMTFNRRSIDTTLVELCQMFNSLKLKILTANIVSFSGKFVHTLLLECDEMDKEGLRDKIASAFDGGHQHLNYITHGSSSSKHDIV